VFRRQNVEHNDLVNQKVSKFVLSMKKNRITMIYCSLNNVNLVSVSIDGYCLKINTVRST